MAMYGGISRSPRGLELFLRRPIAVSRPIAMSEEGQGPLGQIKRRVARMSARPGSSASVALLFYLGVFPLCSLIL